MASVTRLSNAALRASLRAPAFNGRATAFNAARCYSAKSQVRKAKRRRRCFVPLTEAARVQVAKAWRMHWKIFQNGTIS